jgi:hypothetical protein
MFDRGPLPVFEYRVVVSVPASKAEPAERISIGTRCDLAAATRLACRGNDPALVGTRFSKARLAAAEVLIVQRQVTAWEPLTCHVPPLEPIDPHQGALQL